MKILLVCSAGISTSILAVRMRQQSPAGTEILACQAGSLEDFLAGADCVLVAPQIRYQLDRLSALCGEHRVPCELIRPEVYGCLDGRAAYEQACHACGCE